MVKGSWKQHQAARHCPKRRLFKEVKRVLEFSESTSERIRRVKMLQLTTCKESIHCRNMLIIWFVIYFVMSSLLYSLAFHDPVCYGMLNYTPWSPLVFGIYRAGPNFIVYPILFYVHFLAAICWYFCVGYQYFIPQYSRPKATSGKKTIKRPCEEGKDLIFFYIYVHVYNLIDECSPESMTTY